LRVGEDRAEVGLSPRERVAPEVGERPLFRICVAVEERWDLDLGGFRKYLSIATAEVAE